MGYVFFCQYCQQYFLQFNIVIQVPHLRIYTLIGISFNIDNIQSHPLNINQVALLLVLSTLYQLQIHYYYKFLLFFSSTRTLILLARTWWQHLLEILMNVVISMIVFICILLVLTQNTACQIGLLIDYYWCWFIEMFCYLFLLKLFNNISIIISSSIPFH